jgi:hypothetical protein
MTAMASAPVAQLSSIGLLAVHPENTDHLTECADFPRDSPRAHFPQDAPYDGSEQILVRLPVHHEPVQSRLGIENDKPTHTQGPDQRSSTRSENVPGTRPGRGCGSLGVGAGAGPNADVTV